MEIRRGFFVKQNDGDFMGEYDVKNHKVMQKMDKNKLDTFIEVAMKEFAKGYVVANTDDIAKEAGISKGLIFHYFGSKKGLYLFLIKYALDIVNTQYDTVVLEDKNFLDNIERVSRLSIELTVEYPTIYRFLLKSYLSLDDVFTEGLPEDIYNASESVAKRVLRYSDKSLFRDDIDVEKAQDIIIWTMNGLVNRILTLGKEMSDFQSHFDPLMEEFEAYLNVFRLTFYK